MSILEKETYGIKIQCPECPAVLVPRANGHYCFRCKRFFMESEIRQRCGL